MFLIVVNDFLVFVSFIFVYFYYVMSVIFSIFIVSELFLAFFVLIVFIVYKNFISNLMFSGKSGSSYFLMSNSLSNIKLCLALVL